MARKSKLVAFEHWYVQHETEAALLVSEAVDSSKAERFWLPKSVVEIDQEHGETNGRRVIDFTITRSLAEDKGMV